MSLTKLLNLDFLLNKICQSSSKPVDSFPLCFFKGCDYGFVLVGSALFCTLLLVFFIGPSRPPGHFFLTVFFRVFCVFNIKTRGTSQIFALNAFFFPILHSCLKMSQIKPSASKHCKLNKDFTFPTGSSFNSSVCCLSFFHSTNNVGPTWNS